MPARSETSRAQKQAQFKRHVEARQRRDSVRLGARDIMHAVAAFVDDSAYLLEPIDRRIVGFKSTPRSETTSNEGEYRRVEKQPVAIVERAIDENVAL
jgi:hypothetical protein